MSDLFGFPVTETDGAGLRLIDADSLPITLGDLSNYVVPIGMYSITKRYVRLGKNGVPEESDDLKNFSECGRVGGVGKLEK